MAKYRVKDEVGELRHGVGTEVRSYLAGAVVDLADVEATALASALVAVIAALPKKDKKPDP